MAGGPLCLSSSPQASTERPVTLAASWLRCPLQRVSVCVACSAGRRHTRRLVAEIAHARGGPFGHPLDGGQPNPVKDSLIGGQFGHSDPPSESRGRVFFQGRTNPYDASSRRTRKVEGVAGRRRRCRTRPSIPVTDRGTGASRCARRPSPQPTVPMRTRTLRRWVRQRSRRSARRHFSWNRRPHSASSRVWSNSPVCQSFPGNWLNCPLRSPPVWLSRFPA